MFLSIFKDCLSFCFVHGYLHIFDTFIFKFSINNLDEMIFFFFVYDNFFSKYSMQDWRGLI